MTYFAYYKMYITPLTNLTVCTQEQWFSTIKYQNMQAMKSTLGLTVL